MSVIIQGRYEESKAYYAANISKDFFEFHFCYVSQNEVFKEIERFIWDSKHIKTRFKNRYKGPALIDVTDWNGKEINEYFEAFMYYLKDNPDIECTFIVQDKCDGKLLSTMGEFFKIDVIVLGTRPKKTGEARIGFYTDSKEDEKNV